MSRQTAMLPALLMVGAIALSGCGHPVQTMTAAPSAGVSAQAYLPPGAPCGGSGSGGFHGGGGMPQVRAIGPVGPSNPGGDPPYPRPGVTPTPSPCRAR